MPRSSDAKAKMISSAMKLQRMHGVAGTAFSDVIAHSGAPRGSIYHHFPEGRGQLAAAATEYGADWIAAHLETWIAESTPTEALDQFIALWKDIIVEEEYQAGCAVAAGALDPALESPARDAAARGFRTWEEILATGFARYVPEGEAADLAMTCIATIEGALILARAEGSLRPLDVVSQKLREVLALLEVVPGGEDEPSSTT